MATTWPHTEICSEQADPAESIYDELVWLAVSIDHELELLGISDSSDRSVVGKLYALAQGWSDGGSCSSQFGFDGSRWDYDLDPIDEAMATRLENLRSKFTGEHREALEAIAMVRFELDLAFKAYREKRYLLALRKLTMANATFSRERALSSKLIALNAYNNAASEEQRSGLRDVIDHFSPLIKNARTGGHARAQNDPRATEKAFVLECWREWNRHPKNYRSKAAFARDMLSKCKHLTSTKKIEDWCREWEKSEPS